MFRKSLKKSRNRKRSLKNKLSWQSFSFVGTVFLAVGLALSYGAYINKNTALQKEIDKKRSELGRLDQQCMREESRWNAMKTAENLERAMFRHGIEMNLPQAHQIVKMGKDGQPIRDQRSVEWFAKNRRERERGNVVKSGAEL